MSSVMTWCLAEHRTHQLPDNERMRYACYEIYCTIRTLYCDIIAALRVQVLLSGFRNMYIIHILKKNPLKFQNTSTIFRICSWHIFHGFLLSKDNYVDK